MVKFLVLLVLSLTTHVLINSWSNSEIIVFSSGTTTPRQANSETVAKSYPSVGSGKMVTMPLANEIVFVGDVLLARNVEQLSRRNGLSYPFAGINYDIWFPNAYIVGNFEAAIPLNHIPTPMMQVRFSVASSTVAALTDAGFTHLSLANNHALDFDDSGFQNSQIVLSNYDLTPFGRPDLFDKDSITYLKSKNGRLALIALHATVSKPTTNTIKEVLEEASRNSDFQILFVHWGSEYILKSNSSQRQLAKDFVSAGIDLIVGHHPHVVQEVGLIDGVPIFYSLGNYVFDQYATNSTTEGLLISLDLRSYATIRLMPVESRTALSQPHQMTPEAGGQFLKVLAAKSENSLRDDIASGVIVLRNQVATSSKIAMIGRTN